jgi:hypothetical protein
MTQNIQQLREEFKGKAGKAGRRSFDEDDGIPFEKKMKKIGKRIRRIF